MQFERNPEGSGYRFKHQSREGWEHSGKPGGGFGLLIKGFLNGHKIIFMKKYCNGWRYNFKTSEIEFCVNKNKCIFFINYEKEKKPKWTLSIIKFSSIKDFRKCNKYK